MNKEVILRDGTKVQNLGMGSWFLGEKKEREQKEIDAIRAGIESGINLIDTAEMYGEGKSETLIGKAIKDFDRSKLFLVSKVYPHNAGKNHIFTSCRNSIRRLGCDYLDLYLLHWRGSVPFEETIECMERLIDEGLIKRWGVSNLDIDDMDELTEIPGGESCMVDQVLFHVGSRGIEYDLYPWLIEHDIATMAYCPMAQAGTLQYEILHDPVLKEIASAHNISVLNLMLVFVLSKPQMIAIPRTGNAEHAIQNAKMREIKLTDQELALIEKAFPRPRRKMPLDIV